MRDGMMELRCRTQIAEIGVLHKVNPTLQTVQVDS